MLNQIRIVLINTSHPGNIGSVARAMKTMGLKDLYLVSPVIFPSHTADELATGATDILTKATVLNTFEEAIADCTFVIGTSARNRSLPWPLVYPREMAEKVAAEGKESRIAIVFGREHSGLTNEELQLCHLHVQIPANPEYSSLNIAAAVQVIAYELRMASLAEKTAEEVMESRLVNAEEMDMFFSHLQEVMVQTDFLKLSAPRKLMTRMRRLFLRARLDLMEMNMLRGMLTAIQETLCCHRREGGDPSSCCKCSDSLKNGSPLSRR